MDEHITLDLRYVCGFFGGGVIKESLADGLVAEGRDLRSREKNSLRYRNSCCFRYSPTGFCPTGR